MENPFNLHDMEKNLIEKLNEVKIIMDNQRDELAVSIRKDVVAVQLKDMLMENTSFYSLKNALEDYIKDLYDNVQIVEEDKNNEDNK